MSQWPTKQLGEIVKVQNGFAFDSELFTDQSDGMPLIRIRDLARGFTETFYRGAYSEKYVVSGGDFLIGMDGEFRCYRWQGPPALLNQRVCRLLSFSPSVCPDFVFYGINEHLEVIEANTGFSTVKHLSSRQIEEIKIPLPPLAEQERIVRILDEAEVLRRLGTQSDERTNAVVSSLFREMFGDAQLGHVPLGDVTSLITSGVTPRGGEEVYVTDGPYFIRSQNVQMNRLDLSDAACLPADIHDQMRRTKVAEGDVLLNITGASIGRVTWVDALDREANVSQHVCLIRPKRDLLNPAFLSVFVSLPATQHLILQVQAGASRQALNHQQVRALEIPVPPIARQQAFAARVAEIRELETAQVASRQCLDNLFQSLLHRAFQGEL